MGDDRPRSNLFGGALIRPAFGDEPNPPGDRAQEGEDRGTQLSKPDVEVMAIVQVGALMGQHRSVQRRQRCIVHHALGQGGKGAPVTTSTVRTLSLVAGLALLLASGALVMATIWALS